VIYKGLIISILNKCITILLIAKEVKLVKGAFKNSHHFSLKTTALSIASINSAGIR
jgi:hypothetical protein